MKITPPSPQHPTRRLKFFLEHPDWPKAAYWTRRLREELSYKKFKRTHQVAEDVDLMGQRTTVKNYDPVHHSPKETKKSFLKRIFETPTDVYNKMRKAQRGN